MLNKSGHDLFLTLNTKQINLLKALFSGLGKKLPNSVTNLSKYWFDWVLDSKCFPSQPRVALTHFILNSINFENLLTTQDSHFLTRAYVYLTLDFLFSFWTIHNPSSSAVCSGGLISSVDNQLKLAWLSFYLYLPKRWHCSYPESGDRNSSEWIFWQVATLLSGDIRTIINQL